SIPNAKRSGGGAVICAGGNSKTRWNVSGGKEDLRSLRRNSLRHGSRAGAAAASHYPSWLSLPLFHNVLLHGRRDERVGGTIECAAERGGSIADCCGHSGYRFANLSDVRHCMESSSNRQAVLAAISGAVSTRCAMVSVAATGLASDRHRPGVGLHRGTRLSAVLAENAYSERLSLSSRYSHALARFQSRMTVKGERLRTSAVSSTLSPPKNRSSTTLLLRSSNFARFSSASSKATRSRLRSRDTTTASSSPTARIPPPRF